MVKPTTVGQFFNLQANRIMQLLIQQNHNGW